MNALQDGDDNIVTAMAAIVAVEKERRIVCVCIYDIYMCSCWLSIECLLLFEMNFVSKYVSDLKIIHRMICRTV